MLRARGDIAFFMDADLSTPLEEVGRFLAYFDAHPEVDVLIGNRRHPRQPHRAAPGAVRRNLSPLFNRMVRAAAVLPGASWRGHAMRLQGVPGAGGAGDFPAAAAGRVFVRRGGAGAGGRRWGCGWRICRWNGTTRTRRACGCWRDGWTMVRDLRRVRPLVARSLREQPPEKDEG